jgi:2-keto-4-pentenoate hydratase/2-oxohepta-3-ene-1,7-dioic acid hydratase in catechol pathway
MKLIRFGPHGQEKPGVVLADGTRVDASAIGADYDEDFFGSGGLSRLTEWVRREGARAPRVPDGARLGPCVARPSKILCIGLNYVDHARETGAEIPKEPVIFFKSTTALAGPFDDVWIPKGAKKVDWEVELAFVMGKRAKHVPKEKALDCVAGLAVHVDYSEREFQLERGGQWVKGKSCDTFAPLGPHLVTLDEVPNIGDLRLWLHVNGEKRQDSNTRNMIFDVPSLVSYLSGFMTLLPGDVVSTGTPPGVGLGFNPPLYLKAGDVVTCGIDRLGESRQRIVPDPEAA